MQFLACQWSVKAVESWKGSCKCQSFSLLSGHCIKMDYNLYVTLKDDNEIAINGFRSAGITEAIENPKDMVEKVENLFKENWL